MQKYFYFKSLEMKNFDHSFSAKPINSSDFDYSNLKVYSVRIITSALCNYSLMNTLVQKVYKYTNEHFLIAKTVMQLTPCKMSQIIKCLVLLLSRQQALHWYLCGLNKTART